jgi:arsenate reductase (glutaredoxin)
VNKLYAYKNCDSCRKAVKFLREQQIPHEEIPIRETPPTAAELKRVLENLGGDIRRLFNTSGTDYRAMGIKDMLPSMTSDQALELLSSHGNLVKRPLLLTPSTTLIGFKPEEWAAALGK